MLFGITVANHGLFHCARRVLINLEGSAFSCQQRYAPHLAQLHRDLNIRSIEAVLKGAGIRLEALNHRRDAIADFQQAGRKGCSRQRLQRSVFDDVITTTVAFNDTPPSRLAARIDPQDAHIESSEPAYQYRLFRNGRQYTTSQVSSMRLSLLDANRLLQDFLH